MSARWLAVVLTGLAATASACTHEQQVSSAGRQIVAHPPPGAVRGPHVPSGTIFTVRADQPLDTYHTKPGTLFTATVVTPLRAVDGQILVPYGAKVYGAVVSEGPPAAPRLQVALRAIDTTQGTVPVSAAVRLAQHLDWVGPARPEPRFAHELPFDFLEHGTPTGALPLRREPNVGFALARPTEIRVPRGVLIELQLTEPLLLPGAALRGP